MFKKAIVFLSICVIFFAVNSCISTDTNPYKNGKLIYKNACADCHGDNGEGLLDLVPPLAKSDYLAAHQAELIQIITKGLKDTIVVNGKTYSQPMPAQLLTNVQLVNVINYINNAWGNSQTDRFLKDMPADNKPK